MNNEVKFQLSPKFNLIYEFVMPTGRKIKNTLIALLLFVVILVIISLTGNSMELGQISINNNIKVLDILKIICYIVILVSVIKMAFHIVMQAMQYKAITYKFYSNHMVYEDDFLNQHRKEISYANVKEVEIRRTIWDRLLGFGIIIIYTNAENEYSNGLILYSIKNPREAYKIIDNLVHSRDNNEIMASNIENIQNKNDNISEQSKIDDNATSLNSSNISVEQVEKQDIKSVGSASHGNSKESEEDFLESLKNIK